MNSIIQQPVKRDGRPSTLIEGRQYLWQQPTVPGPGSPVRFLSYAACPAIVYVIDTHGQKLLCSRDQLYVLPAGEEQGTHSSLSSF